MPRAPPPRFPPPETCRHGWPRRPRSGQRCPWCEIPRLPVSPAYPRRCSLLDELAAQPPDREEAENQGEKGDAHQVHQEEPGELAPRDLSGHAHRVSQGEDL